MRVPVLLASLTLLVTSAAHAAEDVDRLRALAAEGAQLEELKKDLTQIDGRLQLVEKQYAYRPDPSEGEELRRRYSDGEIQFLLNNYPQASVLFYDLIGNATFRASNDYPEALYMLAESLYQQQNYLGARLYFREHLNLKAQRHFRDSLGRYLEISGRINEFSGIDQYIEQAKGADGSLPTDIAYVYAKWLFRRTDIPNDDRLKRSEAAFSAIADAGGAFQLQAAYFLGVIAVQRKDLPTAAAHFERVLKLPARDPRDKKVQELANLSLGRVYFEQGKYTEAVDRYQEIDYNSENFVDALYEIAWTYVRRGKDAAAANGAPPTAATVEFEKANQACEKLLLAAPDSVIAPEAKILQGHLLLKLGKYQEATDTYTSVINTYLEVYDNIDGLLKAHQDPVAYFQKLIAESDKTFDITALLPPIAVKWATTQREVAEAVKMTGDIDAGKKGVEESNEIANRLLDALKTRGIKAFPTLKEGYERAEAVEAALGVAESKLVLMEERVIGPQRMASLKQELEKVRAQRAELEKKFAELPKTEQEIEVRKKRMADRVTDVEQAAFRLGYQVDSLFAVLTALEKWVQDTRGQRKYDATEEREFTERMRQERELARQLQDELALMQKLIRDEKGRLGMSTGSEGEIRARYAETLREERSLLANARAGSSDQAGNLLAGIDGMYTQIAQLKDRATKAKRQLEAQVDKRAQAVREKVQYEAGLIAQYDKDVKAAGANAQDLVGNIAFESFKRVRRQFQELVLKADVGLVDVAWTRKQDKTNEIQNLARQKDKELKSLDDEFKEVLKEVD